MVLGCKILHPSKSILIDDKNITTQGHGQLPVCSPDLFTSIFYVVVTYLPVDDERTFS